MAESVLDDVPLHFTLAAPFNDETSWRWVSTGRPVQLHFIFSYKQAAGDMAFVYTCCFEVCHLNVHLDAEEVHALDPWARTSRTDRLIPVPAWNYHSAFLAKSYSDYTSSLNVLMGRGCNFPGYYFVSAVDWLGDVSAS